MTVKKETKKPAVKKATAKKPTKKQLEAKAVNAEAAKVAAEAAKAAEVVLTQMPGRNGGGIYHGTINMVKKLKFW
jgi:hypothetical protein